MTNYYCAIAPADKNYVLAAISQNVQIIFEGFACAPLSVLAQKFKTYGLVLAAPDDCLDIQTHFCHPQDSSNAIYQKIATQSAIVKRTTYFDFERINTPENNSDEQLIISYHLRDFAFIAPYRQLGFTLAALEPFSLVQKRTLNHAWQKQAMTNFLSAPCTFDPTLAELTLKLLDRENFYASLDP
jgi:hypothetical protein